MDGGHETLIDADALFQKDVNNRRETVGGAGSVRNDVVAAGIVFLVVDSHHDSDVLLFGRS